MTNSVSIPLRPPATRQPARDTSIRVIVVDEHPVIGDAIRNLLSKTEDLLFCGHATSSEQALDLINEYNPNVVVMDLSLQDAYGLDFTEQLHRLFPEIHILIYSMYNEYVFGERALDAGASGYVMKKAPTSSLLEGIRSIMRNETYLSPRMTSRLLNKITKGPKSVPNFALDELTQRELAVLVLMSEGTGPQNMADILNLDRKTVETHRRRVKEKLGFDSVSALLHYATQWRHSQGQMHPSN